MRVLLVGDEKGNNVALAYFLDHSDVEILAVTDSVEAARCITNQHFDAIILDVHMPHRMAWS